MGYLTPKVESSYSYVIIGRYDMDVSDIHFVITVRMTAGNVYKL